MMGPIANRAAGLPPKPGASQPVGPPPRVDAPPQSGPKKPSAAETTAKEFEAVFLGEMTKLMMTSVEVGDEFSGGHGEEMFRGVLAEKLGQEIANRGGVGLAPAVLAQMIRMQGGTQGDH